MKLKIFNFYKKYEYIEDEPITGGAFGQIYRIRDKKVKTEFVLKKIRKNAPNEKKKNPGHPNVHLNGHHNDSIIHICGRSAVYGCGERRLVLQRC